ncbi:MAG: hypothetical protein ACXIT9_01825 [Nitritalea sp.]
MKSFYFFSIPFRRQVWGICCFALIGGLVACQESEEVLPEQEQAARFTRLPNFSWERGHVANLTLQGDRLFYSNALTPGFFSAAGTQEQFSARSFDMNFGQAHGEILSIGALDTRASLLAMANTDYNSLDVLRLNALTIPDHPANYQLNPGWFGLPSFGVQGNVILSSWVDPLGGSSLEDRVFLVQVDAQAARLPVINQEAPVIEKILLDYRFEDRPLTELYSVFAMESGWLISGGIAGRQSSFVLSEAGAVTPLFEDLRRFVVLGTDTFVDGSRLVLSEEGLFRSASGNVMDLEPVFASSTLRGVRVVEERIVVWTGTDELFELEGEGDSATLTRINTEGLEDLQFTDVALFDGFVHIATRNGLFKIAQDDFWMPAE